MSVELVSILVLVAVFVLGTTLSINMGVLAFVAAFAVGTIVTGKSTDDIVGGFPSNLFVILVGVTYLFAIAKSNGTVDWLVRAAIRVEPARRHRHGELPRPWRCRYRTATAGRPADLFHRRRGVGLRLDDRHSRRADLLLQRGFPRATTHRTRILLGRARWVRLARLRRAALPNGDDIVTRVFGSEDFHTAVAAFGTKRQIKWTGH
ncbi:MAG: hypothetical protein ABW224_00340 [Kibdelosporangium sp.]